jgi:hypothetical protein
MTNDTFHTYTFDAEGNITAVDSGGAAQYVYNALNQRVQAVVGGTITEYVFSAAAQRVSEWNGTTRAQLKGKYQTPFSPRNECELREAFSPMPLPHVSHRTLGVRP